MIYDVVYLVGIKIVLSHLYKIVEAILQATINNFTNKIRYHSSIQCKTSMISNSGSPAIPYSIKLASPEPIIEFCRVKFYSVNMTYSFRSVAIRVLAKSSG